MAAIVTGGGYLLVPALLRFDLQSYGEVGFFVILGIVLWRLAETVVIQRSGRTAPRQSQAFEEFTHVRRRRWYLSAILLGATMQYLLFVSSVTVWAIFFVVTLFGSLLGCELLTSAANLDRETQTLTYEGTSISLDSLAGV